MMILIDYVHRCEIYSLTRVRTDVEERISKQCLIEQISNYVEICL